MIKYTELRCGNKVHISGKEYPNERLVATVGEIHYFGSTLECDFGEGEGEEDCDIDHEDLIPIQLSEEWLIRADFESNPYDDTYVLTGFVIHHDATKGKPLFWIEWVMMGTTMQRRLDYVHELQNCYKEFRCEELTFKDL